MAIPADAAISTAIDITRVSVSAYTIPTASPESDGTLGWDHTTLILVEIEAAGMTGIGYTYGHEAVATVIRRSLSKLLTGRNAWDIRGIYSGSRRKSSADVKA